MAGECSTIPASQLTCNSWRWVNSMQAWQENVLLSRPANSPVTVDGGCSRQAWQENVLLSRPANSPVTVDANSPVTVDGGQLTCNRGRWVSFMGAWQENALLSRPPNSPVTGGGG
ncbi:hypothetical protein RRG08_066958 [Elysia crispata]|uniref:Uncharacterized protein n=1 Tax=Elysia crispata TaxID=231223 RepID=A0AAE1CYS3_9GAST|nr:hypothetical protein RRG08_066958 [Elysia crispata]